MANWGWIAAALTVASTLAIALGLRATGKADGAGLFGPGPLLADLNLLFEILVVIGLTVGMGLARSGNIEAHRRNQTTWVLVNLVFVAFLMVGSISTFKWHGWAELRNPGILATWMHATIGACTVLAGTWLVLQMNDVLPRALHVRGWKTLMRVTLAGYWLVALLGIATYRAWYAS